MSVYLGCEKTKDVEESVERLKVISDFKNNIILKHTKITKEMLEENYKLKKDWWFSPEEALNIGIVDEIIK